MSTIALFNFFSGNPSDNSLAEFLEQLKKAELFDPLKPFGDHASFFHAWVSNPKMGLFPEVGPKTLEVIWSKESAELFSNLTPPSKKNPDSAERFTLSSRQKSSTNLMELYLLNINNFDQRHAALPPALGWLLSHVDPHFSLNWRAHEKDPGKNQAHGSLWEMFLNRGTEQDLKHWVDQSWPIARLEDIPLVAGFKHAFLWDAFLAQGGDPNMKIKGVALWEALLSSGNSLMKESAQEWARTNQDSALEDLNIEKYWKKLQAYHTLADLKKAMRSHPDWSNLRDEQGRNPLMVAMKGNSQIWKDVQTNRKCATLACQTDNSGKNLWFYLLNNSRELSNNEPFTWALKNLPIVEEPNGLGWLGWIREMNEHHAFPISPISSKLLTVIPSHVWLPSTASQQQELAHFLKTEIWWGTPRKENQRMNISHARIHDFLSECFQRWPETSVDLEKVFATSVLIRGHSFSQEIRKAAWNVILGDDGGFDIELCGKYGKNNYDFLESYLAQPNSEQWEIQKINSAKRDLKKAIPEGHLAKVPLRL